jgi:hypothetical protein
MVGAVGVLTGCGDMATGPNSGTDDPVVVGNTGKGQDGNTVNNGDVTQTGLLGEVVGGLLNVVEESVTKVVGRVGGTLSTELTSGQTKFVVPFGALNGPVQIELEATQAKIGEQYITVYEFGPHGLEFNKATKLSLLLPYAEGTIVTFRWFNPETNQWEVQARKPVRNGKVEFSVNHFSKYGIS